jgi:choline/glycine/proline betaine transport protein
VSTGLPFAVVLLIGVYSLYIGLDQEAYVESAVKRAMTKAESDHQLKEAVSSVVGLEQAQS